MEYKLQERKRAILIDGVDVWMENFVTHIYELGSEFVKIISNPET